MDANSALPGGYLLRPPEPHEASDVDRLSTAADAALGAPPTLSEGLIRRMWSRPRFDLRTDAWIVERERTVVGFAQVWVEDPARLSGFVLVHPNHTGRGIGSVLATLVEHRAAEHAVGDARLFSAAIPEDKAAARLLADRGYTWARRFWHMDVELAAAPGATEPPPGISLRALDQERDLPAVHRLLEEAFVDHWDHHPSSYEEFLDQNVRVEDFDPELWIVATEGDALVGILCGSERADRGAVDWLGVLRSRRGQGVASALLREGFAVFRRRGLSTAGLSVDSANPTGAVSVYERQGMRVVASFDLWGRAIRGEPS